MTEQKNNNQLVSKKYNNNNKLKEQEKNDIKDYQRTVVLLEVLKNKLKTQHKLTQTYIFALTENALNAYEFLHIQKP